MKEDYKTLWQNGYGVISHSKETLDRIAEMEVYFSKNNIQGEGVSFYEMLVAADRLTNAAMWLVAHQTYAKNIYLDGRELTAVDFKKDPQGHMGSSLNMIPGYVGYMLINALTGFTRSWVMEQGHAVAAIDNVNLLLNNMMAEHAGRYNLSDAGLSKFAQDFYSYKLNEKGKQDSPLGSHVNCHTAGGHLEGGYLGFASLQYVHMPLLGEKLVAFLSDGAFEEQRGSDWAHRWWRAEDCGLIAPIMIANGRRIDQRSSIDQEGGAEWFAKHLIVNGFDPIIFDGRDPAAFAWSIFEQEKRLQEAANNVASTRYYKIKIPYGIAVAPKGAGFYNEGTNYAHNLPLVDNPGSNIIAAQRFNYHVQKMFVPFDELKNSVKVFQNHQKSKRKLEKDHPLANRDVSLKSYPKLEFKTTSSAVSPMDAIDGGFLAIVKSNSHLRVRIGNPDEISSNKMNDALESLKLRVVDSEVGAKESVLGKIITALNEEAVAAAAFGNKGGINLIVTYEAFGTKMLGEARQEIIFSKNKKNCGRPGKWLSVPIILTSNSWENSKNELSHQDPSFCENMLLESSDISRVVFPADFNSALETINHIYKTHGQIWSVVVPKSKMPIFFNEAESIQLVRDGAIRISQDENDIKNAVISILAIGSYQLAEVLKASKRLKEFNIAHVISYIFEPGKFRNPRNDGEAKHIANEVIQKNILPDSVKNLLIVCHAHPEVAIGTLQPLWQGKNVSALGFINQGGTLNVDGMMFVNKCSWAHILQQVEKISDMKINLLNDQEKQALSGKISPENIIINLGSEDIGVS